MPNDMNTHPTNQNTLTAMKTAPANTEILKPLGTFSLLPREIRDEIYGHVFSKNDRAFYSASILISASYEKLDRSSPAQCKMRIGSNLSVLCLSKAIKDEAMPLLYSKATFRFYHGLDERYDIKIPRRLNADIISRMTNVEIFYDAGPDPAMVELDPGVDLNSEYSSEPIIEWISNSYRSAPAGPLDFFRGASITRKSILIVLSLNEWGSYATEMIEPSSFSRINPSPLFNALEHLTGFETVTLRLLVQVYRFCPPRGTSKATEQEWVVARQWEKVYSGHGIFLSTLSKALEPTLGKGNATGDFVFGKDGILSFPEQRDIIFHPKDHQAAISKAEEITTNRNNP